MTKTEIDEVMAGGFGELNDTLADIGGTLSPKRPLDGATQSAMAVSRLAIQKDMRPDFEVSSTKRWLAR